MWKLRHRIGEAITISQVFTVSYNITTIPLWEERRNLPKRQLPSSVQNSAQYVCLCRCFLLLRHVAGIRHWTIRLCCTSGLSTDRDNMMQAPTHLVSAAADEKNLLWRGGLEIITSSVWCRQDADIRGDPHQAAAKCYLRPFVWGKMTLRPTSCLITPNCSSSFFTRFCLYDTFLFPLLEACTHTLRWYTHQPTSLPLRTECAMEPRVHQAGREASVSSLPVPPYLLIKELLNSQKLQRVQEWSIHSNTIRKHHHFFSLPPTYIHFKFLSSSQTFPHRRSCIILGAYKCENYKSIKTAFY